jgi:hypothetical protein
MSDIASRLHAFQAEVPHWVDLLAQEPARYILRHDTIHPAFHGCIDWHSACHATWALLAHRGLTGDPKYEAIVDDILMSAKISQEGADLAARPQFEMPYGRAWFLRLALEDRIVTGSTRLQSVARDVATSLVGQYRSRFVDPFAREYANPCWALINLLDYAVVEDRSDLVTNVQETASQMLPAFDRIPAESEEASWPDFMAVTPMFCELCIRTGVIGIDVLLDKVGTRLHDLRPIVKPLTAHHYALNFSRSWAFLALAQAGGGDDLVQLALDHIETNLYRPSWWRGDYRSVGHWVPQFGIFALQRALKPISSF